MLTAAATVASFVKFTVVSFSLMFAERLSEESLRRLVLNSRDR